jgi:GMP synthase (glutamine-hydrolysing)
MNDRTVLFIDCLHTEHAYMIIEHLSNIFNGEYTFRKISAKSDLPMEGTVNRWLDELNIAGLIISGSMSSVNDEELWIKRLIEFTRKLIGPDTADVPCLGLCFGHQIIAKACGVQVKSHPEAFVGLIDISVVKSDSPLFAGLSDSYRAFVHHTDEVTAVPRDFSLITSTANVKVHGMQHNSKPIYSVQSHPEVQHHIVKDFLDAYKLNYTSDEFAAHDGDVVMKNFAKIVEEKIILQQIFVLNKNWQKTL